MAAKIAESSHVRLQAGSRDEVEMALLFKFSKSDPSDTPLTRPHLLNLPERSNQLRPNIQIYTPMGDISHLNHHNDQSQKKIKSRLLVVFVAAPMFWFLSTKEGWSGLFQE